MKLSEIKTEVENLIQDTSFTSSLGDYIEQCIAYVGAQVDLPELKRVSVIDTILEQAYVSLTGLTGGFSGKLRRVKNSDGDNISIYPNLELLMDSYGTMDDEGDIEAVALEGNTLWYQKIPSTEETLTCLYYKNPENPATDNDSPSDFPSHLHRLLFVHGTAWMIYDQIEDDVEGGKINTKSNFWLSFDEGNKHSGIVKLREWIAKTKRHNISSSWSV